MKPASKMLISYMCTHTRTHRTIKLAHTHTHVSRWPRRCREEHSDRPHAKCPQGSVQRPSWSTVDIETGGKARGRAEKERERERERERGGGGEREITRC